jgi:uncharacterized oxidoreductase
MLFLSIAAFFARNSMEFRNQTVFITGGSSGIGLELARQLIDKQNSVIICGRSADKLAEAHALVPKVQTVQCDIANENDRTKLFDWITIHHPRCNVLINNAAIVHRTDFHKDDAMLQKAEMEIRTNLVAPIALTKMFLERFGDEKGSAIINITTGLVYAPRAVYPVYNATKAALHSFTQVLRHQVQHLPVNIAEVLMPVVATPWHKGNVPKVAITPKKAVSEMIAKLEAGEKEIRVGKVKLLYMVSRIAPALAFRIINRIS